MRKRRGISTKALVALLALVLVIGCSLGGTLAWLVDKTNTVTNTFTVGDINILLTETDRTYMILPGVDIPKDPTVTVEANSEACWLFVKVDEVNWPGFMNGENRKVDYRPAAGWIALDEEKHPGVYWKEVDAETAKAGNEWQVLAGSDEYPDGVVTVSNTLTKSEIAEVKKQGQPLLTFTAYAVQKEAADNAAGAWEIANPTTTP